MSEQIISTITEEFFLSEDAIETNSQLPELVSSAEDEDLEEEIEDELIIEDFTIDGICGVY